MCEPEGIIMIKFILFVILAGTTFKIMRKIIIKLPDKKVNSFRLQRNGWIGRRYKNPSNLINTLEHRLNKEFTKSLQLSAPNNNKQTTAIIVRELSHVVSRTKFNICNESLNSNRVGYLVYCTTCFLEDYLTKGFIKKIERKYANSNNS